MCTSYFICFHICNDICLCFHTCMWPLYLHHYIHECSISYSPSLTPSFHLLHTLSISLCISPALPFPSRMVGLVCALRVVILSRRKLCSHSWGLTHAASLALIGRVYMHQSHPPLSHGNFPFFVCLFFICFTWSSLFIEYLYV